MANVNIFDIVRFPFVEELLSSRVFLERARALQKGLEMRLVHFTKFLGEFIMMFLWSILIKIIQLTSNFSHFFKFIVCL